MQQSTADISLVILTYNAIDHVEELFGSLGKQTIKPEIIVLDSQSTDGTREFLASRGINYTEIKKGEFNHGGTRNVGLNLAKNELVVFVTQDVIFENPNALELVVAPLRSGDDIAMSFGRQLPKKDATLLSEFARLNNYPDKSIVKSLKETNHLGIKNCFISNSFAAYKKSKVIRLGGFPSHLIMCEDVYVGGKGLLQGYKIAYVAESRVFHSHNYTIGEEFRRYFDIGFFYNSEDWILKNFAAAESEGFTYIMKEMKYLARNKKLWMVPEFFIRTVAKYVGYKLGKYQKILPVSIKSQISMHSWFWRNRKAQLN
jgi:rhamnosyltransferase